MVLDKTHTKTRSCSYKVKIILKVRVINSLEAVPELSNAEGGRRGVDASGMLIDADFVIMYLPLSDTRVPNKSTSIKKSNITSLVT